MSIGERIRQRRENLQMSQDELAQLLGYKSRSSVAKIEKDGRGLPQNKIAEIAKHLHTTPAYIMGWEHEEEQAYYINPETAKLAQEIHDDPELRILMDASRDLEPEDIKFVVDLVKKLKLKERGDHADWESCIVSAALQNQRICLCRWGRRRSFYFKLSTNEWKQSFYDASWNKT